MFKYDGNSSNKSEFYGLFKSFWHMNDRCTNEKHKSYKLYGGRGVSVCGEWKDYLIFKRWALANGWKKGLVISRNGDVGNYEPSNCKWKTVKVNTLEALTASHKARRLLSDEQVRLVRASKLSRAKMADELGVSQGTIQAVREGRSYQDVK